MSAGPNDLQGFTKKTGITPQVELQSHIGQTSNISEFGIVKRMEGNCFHLLSEIGLGTSGVVLTEPGFYLIELYGVYSSAASRATYITSDFPAPWGTPDPTLPYAIGVNYMVSGGPGLVTATLIARGGETIRAACSGSANNENSAYLRISKII